MMRRLRTPLFAAVTALSCAAYGKQTTLRRSSIAVGFSAILASFFHANVASMDGCSGTVTYINASTAKSIDDKLMSTNHFTLEQLMELAGLSVAASVHDFMTSTNNTGKRVLVICGPGNNGGDGLVAARHLAHFGYTPTILYPKEGKSNHYFNLLHQCRDLNISVTSSSPDFNDFDVIIDALFGFSYHGPPREPYATLITALANSRIPVVSVDIPSGWDVEKGDIYQMGFVPAAVVSLTAPKACMISYAGTHYLGGRFIPPVIQKEFNLCIPSYGSNANQFVRLSPSPVNDWELYATSEGHPYYYNHATGASAWASISPPDTTVSMLLSTASSLAEAKKLASELVKRRLVACVNIVPQVTSVYEWNGKVEDGEESMMIIKTRKELVPEVTAAIKELHSYDVPEVIATDITGGNKDYLKWVGENTVPRASTEHKVLEQKSEATP